MSYVGRFAPSPTGPLHFGSLVAALASHLDARAAGGRWLVRIEDVDTPRTVPGAADAILRTLEAVGLHWDGEVVWQSKRTPLYEAALERLRAAGHVYGCRCSRREIADSGLAGLEGTIYPGTCRRLRLASAPGLAERMIAPDRVVAFEDRACGRVSQNVAGEIGDFVVRRRDGLIAYQLAVVVDDAEQGVTDVVRGADLLLSTPRQILLQRALGIPAPRYLHVAVVTNAAGEKLSKQTAAPPVEAADASASLARALQFLGQPRVEHAAPAAMVAQAVAQFDGLALRGRSL
ncbi:MAG TPA: tRNA glutamyl-Q(34) synthetase GluQRS [Usitatibacter sp.]|nr:tRNA glutamyl-Q(34) synthetase GluQRS [Usitatibacter sp.]